MGKVQFVGFLGCLVKLNVRVLQVSLVSHYVGPGLLVYQPMDNIFVAFVKTIMEWNAGEKTLMFLQFQRVLGSWLLLHQILQLVGFEKLTWFLIVGV